jgi:general secretion pathway protein B
MSFILDALKKSEIERQRQTMPGLMDTRAPQPHGRLPVWAIWLGGLLAINMIVLTVVLMRNAAPAAPAAVKRADTAPAAADRKAPAAAEHFSPLDSAPVYAPEIPVTAAAAAAAANGPASNAVAAVPHSAASRDAPRAAFHRPDPVLIDEESKADDQEVLPSVNELNLTGAQALPDLHLDVHVYATKPADRFVYINMRKYREGNSLPEGPVVERIRRDGVVLNFQGLRFILPRQS